LSIIYLRWARWLTQSNDKSPNDPPNRISARMFYQNARLYDEWKGEDYEGSSCRGAMKGFHKHGVCEETYWPNFAGRKPGTAKAGWDESAPQTPLGAFRIDGKSLIDMQSAIFEAHAIYVSADVHDGWDRVPAKQIDRRGVDHPPKTDTGGRIHAIVGYGRWLHYPEFLGIKLGL
jgi:hypothetical protein